MSTKILVVEDDPQNLYLTKFLLERAGHEIVVATDGVQAVALAECRPDLILMDMLMPRLDGWAATRKIRELYGRAIPIVALTSYSMKGDRESIIQVGCDGCITKPIDPETFCEQVELYLQPRVQEDE
ncbi:MAG: response regulator [Actinobacteria bacterium]|nr:response regulator [Actinomycetota bacterium]